jgi:hypothetical protein
MNNYFYISLLFIFCVLLFFLNKNQSNEKYNLNEKQNKNDKLIIEEKLKPINCNNQLFKSFYNKNNIFDDSIEPFETFAIYSKVNII